MAVWPWAEKLWAHAEQAGQLIFAYFLVVCVHDWHETEKPQPLQYEYEALIEALIQAAKKKNKHTHTYIYTYIPVVPHKAVAEVSKIGNL